MNTDITVVLNSLHCLRESDGSGGSEPYVWPALLWVDDRTLATPAKVGVTTPALANARVVLRQNMRAGETVAFPTSVGVSHVRVDDILKVRALFFVVALWESDETPTKAMRAGFQAFSGELRAAIADNLLGLASANPAERAAIIATIRTRVANRVRNAIKDGLSAFEKAQVALGTLNLDDIVDVAFTGSGGQPASAPITLNFQSGDLTNRYQALGSIAVQPVPVDRCQARVDAARAAQADVDGIEAEIRQLQVELKDASPGDKPRIIREIGRIRTQELVPANRALEAAKQALATCRGGGPVVSPGDAQPVTSSV